MKFLKNFLASFLALVAFFFFAIIAIVGIIAAASSKDEVSIKENSVLKLDLSGLLQEQSIDNPFEELLQISNLKTIGLIELIKVLDNAANDDDIKGIYMKNGFLNGGPAAMQELRDALNAFKQSGKFIYSYAEYLGESDYYLTSVADTLMIHPQGNVEFNGLNANITFFKGMFEKIGVQPQVFRVGDYKGAVEPFIREKLSEENRFQIQERLNIINDQMLRDIADNLTVDVDQLKMIQNEMKMQLPEDGKQLGLIQQVGYEDQLLTKIAYRLKEDEVKDINFISASEYASTIQSKSSKNRVAVIIGEGSIVMEGDENTNIVGKKFAKEIKKARENDKVKAIVLRINSPGGSLIASDLIWREVELTKPVKPIIASFSSYAASGGYYISMGCDTIVARPTTITGSIGIFGMLFNVEKLKEEKIGLTSDVVSTGKFSDILTMSRALNKQERAIFQRVVDSGYKSFITKAAEGRSMLVKEINDVGGGRVWTGSQAIDHGLVDVLGSYRDAVSLASNMAGVEDDFKVSIYPKPKPFFQQILEDMTTSVRISLLGHDLSTFLDEITLLDRYTFKKGLQARMPELIIE